MVADASAGPLAQADDDVQASRPTPATQQPRCSSLVPGIAFEIDKATLTSQSRLLLDALAFALRGDSSTMVVVGRYNQDQVGRREYLQIGAARFASQRARSVEMYLIKSGVDRSRITVRAELVDIDPLRGSQTIELEMCRRSE
jgi:outer membrane protein OmpA-like peptidoglycan-associated protein